MKITSILPQARQNTQNRKTQAVQSFGTVRFTNVTTGKDVAHLELIAKKLKLPQPVKNIPHTPVYDILSEKGSPLEQELLGMFNVFQKADHFSKAVSAISIKD